jgi:hypothetical protein
MSYAIDTFANLGKAVQLYEARLALFRVQVD